MIDKKKSARDFSKYWANRGDEKSDTQSFWLSLLRDVYGVKEAEKYIFFEQKVKLDNTSFIDARIPEAKVIIEQKSKTKDLNKAIKQSDGSLLTPFQQAKRYITELPVSEHPKYVITCNFNEFYIYDMENPKGEPEIIYLKELEKDYYRMNFLIKENNPFIEKEKQISVEAGNIVGELYNAFLKEYKNSNNPNTLHSLNILCVRLVFCLYAEDADIFPEKNQFYNYLSKYETEDMRDALIKLFQVLNQKEDERDPYLKASLTAFPYVNGGLFAEDNIEIPNFSDEIKDLILNKASRGFDWSQISPTIFGAVFESTLNPETRRHGGMHYTSIENIHKLIDPLFLDDLKSEYRSISSLKKEKDRFKKLNELQEKLSKITLLDPACGSGNFLTESYIALRKLENKIIADINNQFNVGQLRMAQENDINPIKVSINQFYGIEINDFAVTVAMTALWIAESQMMTETKRILHFDLDFLPLKSNSNIICENALSYDWRNLVSPEEISYIIGNPPFIGAYSLNNAQKKERELIWGKGCGILDYVTCWYKKSADYIKNNNIKVAFVSTNSISQGQQVSPLWKELRKMGFEIEFAYKSFPWNSQATSKANVFVVIIAFSHINKNKKKLFNNEFDYILTDSINGYLMEGNDIFIEKRNKPLCPVPEMSKGFQPTDNGYLLLSEDEYWDIIKKDPSISAWIRPFSMGEDFIKGKNRYCLWLENASPKDIKSHPFIKDRVKKCKEWREKQKPTGDAYKLKDIPTKFRPCKKFVDATYIGFPKVSSSARKYVPIGFVENGMIPGDMIYFINTSSLYHLGVLTSNVHMAWMRAFCGRLGNGYRYNNTIVYNNFPWPKPTDKQKAKIEATAQAILDARAKYAENSLADLYDEVMMPSELRTAHQNNDKAVIEAYGLEWRGMKESECLEHLIDLYLNILK